MATSIISGRTQKRSCSSPAAASASSEWVAVDDNRNLWLEVALYEAALHGSAAWHCLLRALEDLTPIPVIDEQHRIIDEAYATWRATDNLVRAFQRTAE